MLLEQGNLSLPILFSKGRNKNKTVYASSKKLNTTIYKTENRSGTFITWGLTPSDNFH